MARQARGEYLDPQTIQIVHVTNRCVRRAFLCGEDPYSGRSYEHRREWIRARLEFLASAFAIDCLTFAVMSNHLHLVLRSRPDVVRSWSDEEVARRWLRLCPVRKSNEKPTDSDLAMILNDPRRVAELRSRLSDISWWMGMTAERIAREANREDDCTGRFWEGRFRAQLLLDEAAVLACAMYVDLNPIRAAMAESLDDSKFTGAKARLDDLRKADFDVTDLVNGGSETQPTASRRTGPNRSKSKPKRTRRWERSGGRKRSGWLSPIEIAETADPIGPDRDRSGRRASLKGFLSMPLVRYLELLDWTGRQIRSDKRGSIPARVAPILDQLGIAGNRWLNLVANFGSLFKRAVGSSVAMAGEAERRGQNWMQAPGASCFG